MRNGVLGVMPRTPIFFFCFSLTGRIGNPLYLTPGAKLFSIPDEVIPVEK